MLYLAQIKLLLELLETEKQCIEDRRADLVAWVQDTKTGNPYLLHIEMM